MRDFRDAKAMAHALRDALKVRGVKATHSECLELIAKAFGYDNWNILSAKIETARSRQPNGRALPPAGAYDPVLNKTASCSFCGKTQHEVEMGSFAGVLPAAAQRAQIPRVHRDTYCLELAAKTHDFS